MILFKPKSEIIQNNKTFNFENIKTTFNQDYYRLVVINITFKNSAVAEALA